MSGNFKVEVDWVHKWRAKYDKSIKQWIFPNLTHYNEVLQYVKSRFPACDVFGIPTMAFTLLGNTIPFSDKRKGTFVHRWDYCLDMKCKPELTDLPKRLFD